MKSLISGIVALVGAVLAVVYMVLLVIDLVPFIQYLDVATIIKLAVGVVGAIIALAGAGSAFKKTLASVILRGVGAVLLIVFGVLVAFEALVIAAIAVLAVSIALDYIIK